MLFTFGTGIYLVCSLLFQIYINIVHHVHKADMFIVITFRLDVHTPDTS